MKIKEEETRLIDTYSDQQAYPERGGARDQEEREFTRKVTGFSENFNTLYEQLEAFTANRTEKQIDSYLFKLNVITRDYQELGKTGVSLITKGCRKFKRKILKAYDS